MDWARNLDFIKGVEPKGKMFCEKNASMGKRAEQTGATHAYQRRESGGRAPRRWKSFVIFQ